MFRLGLMTLCFVALASWCSAQDDRTTIKKSLIPATGSDTRDFIPAGWKLEEQQSSDLDNDGTADYILKLIETKPAKTSDGMPNDRARALIVLLQGADGKLSRAAVADKLLQCTGCGGALYGEAPANVKIENYNVILVEQDHGSREVSDVTFRFRYDATSKRFILIGFDYAERDRATGKSASESTNYLTGVRKTNGRASTITKTKMFLDDVDYEKLEEDAVKRLGLG